MFHITVNAWRRQNAKGQGSTTLTSIAQGTACPQADLAQIRACECVRMRETSNTFKLTLIP